MITYLKGDIISHQTVIIRNTVIAHICNDAGGWGKGFVLSLSRKWKQPEIWYRAAYLNGETKLGTTQFILVENINGNALYVANMIAQNGYRSSHSIPGKFVCYESLQKTLAQVGQFATDNNADIVMPRIGVGLGGGKWEEIEPLINSAFANLNSYVYDL